MAEIVPVNASLPPCPLDVNFDVTSSVPLSAVESDNFVFVESKHPNKVLEGLNSLRLNNAFCDVIICCGGQEFSCHRIVLASFSSYFQVNVDPLHPFTFITLARLFQK